MKEKQSDSLIRISPISGFGLFLGEEEKLYRDSLVNYINSAWDGDYDSVKKVSDRRYDLRHVRHLAPDSAYIRQDESDSVSGLMIFVDELDDEITTVINGTPVPLVVAPSLDEAISRMEKVFRNRCGKGLPDSFDFRGHLVWFEGAGLW